MHMHRGPIAHNLLSQHINGVLRMAIGFGIYNFATKKLKSYRAER
jgi:hypothetical protein